MHPFPIYLERIGVTCSVIALVVATDAPDKVSIFVRRNDLLCPDWERCRHGHWRASGQIMTHDGGVNHNENFSTNRRNVRRTR
jgi:hypothetical protein